MLDKEDSASESSSSESEVDLDELTKQEAAKLTEGLSATTVNGRTLRDRTKIQAPKDAYWERFGKKTSEKLAATEHKREMLDDLKAWKKEFGPQDPNFVWKTFTLKSATADIEAFHDSVIQNFPELRDNLVDDDEYESPEEDEDSDSEMEEEEESESEEEESEEEGLSQL